MDARTVTEAGTAVSGRIEELSNLLQKIRGGAVPGPAERAEMAAGMKPVPKLHALHTLSEEHQFILGSLRELASFVARLDGYATFTEMGADLEVLRGIAHHLVDAESHHQREEEVLFPRIEARGISLPTEHMRKDHVRFRARKRRLYQLAQAGAVGEFADFKAEVGEIGLLLSGELADHIFQEDTLIYQIALEVLSPEQWADVKRGCDAIGYCCFKPEDQVPAGRQAAAEELDLRTVPMIRRLDTILSTWKRLAPGQSMRITNDKEPRPLYTLFRTSEKGKFEWIYETEGPAEWVALITKLTTEQREQ